MPAVVQPLMAEGAGVYQCTPTLHWSYQYRTPWRQNKSVLAPTKMAPLSYRMATIQVNVHVHLNYATCTWHNLCTCTLIFMSKIFGTIKVQMTKINQFTQLHKCTCTLTHYKINLINLLYMYKLYTCTCTMYLAYLVYCTWISYRFP